MKTFNAVRKLIAILLVFTLVFDVNVVNNFSSYAFGNDEEATFANEVVEDEITEEVEVEDETEVEGKAEADVEVEVAEEVEAEVETEVTEEAEANVETETDEEAGAEVETGVVVEEANDEVAEVKETVETCETTLESETTTTTEVVVEVEETVVTEETTAIIATDSEIEEETALEEVIVATDSEIDEIILEEVIIATDSQIELLNSVESKLYNDLYNLDNTSVTYEDGVIYLQKDITLNEAIVINTEEHLNLNSYSIYGKNSSVFVCENANLVIDDNKEKQTPGSIVGYSEEPTLIVNGGNVTLGYIVIRNHNYNNAENAATVVINDATVVIDGADIKGALGKSYSNNRGADGGTAVLVNYSNDENTFTFKSGKITGGTGGNGIDQIVCIPGSPFVLNDKKADREEYIGGRTGELGGGNGGNALVVNCKNENNIIIESRSLVGGNAGDKYKKKSEQNGLNVLKASSLPSAYNSVDAGYVKRTQCQGSLPHCITFATMATIETYMQKFYPTEMAELGFETGMIDLSENAFVRATHFGHTDPLGNAKRFTSGINEGKTDVTGQMIGQNEVFNALSKWWGPFSSKIEPWGIRERVEEPFPDDVANPTNVVARFKSVEPEIAYDEDKMTEEEFLNTIKKGIFDNGVLMVIMKLRSQEGEFYFNERYEQIKDTVSADRKAIVDEYATKYTFSQDFHLSNDEVSEAEFTLHAVAAVGYDDNFPKEYFEGVVEDSYGELFTCMDPKRDGAFLIRNSWGEDNEFTWVPYEWAIKTGYFFPIYFELHNKEDHLYYYDGGMYNEVSQAVEYRDGYSYQDLVNIFKVQGNQEIKSIMNNFGIVSAKANLRIYEVEDNSAAALDNLFNSDNIAEKTLYSKDNVGGYWYQTIDLDEPVYVEDGKYVAVCLSAPITTSGAGLLTATYDTSFADKKHYSPAESANSSYVRQHLSRDLSVYNTTHNVADIIDTFSNFKPISEGLNGYAVFDDKRTSETYRKPCNLTIRMITHDATVVKSNVTLNANGGKFSDESSTKTFEVESDKTFGDYDAFVEPTRDGYIFDKWVDDTTNPTREFDGNSRTSKNKTIYATWTKVYKVTYNMNGHGTQIEPEIVREGEKFTKPANPTEKGWGFNFWKAEGETTQFDWTVAPTSNVVLNANWFELQYMIYFDPMGGTYYDSSMTTFSLTYTYSNGRASLYDCADFTKEGYEPVGWYDNKEFTGEPITSIPAHTEGHIYGQEKQYLYLKWVPAKYDVIFDMAGHGTQISPMEVEYGSKITKPTDPLCDGFIFMGWQDETGGTYDFSSPVKKDKTLTARWKKAYKISFVTGYDNVTVEPMLFAEGDWLTAPKTPIHERNLFKSWQLNGEDFIFGNHQATEDLTLTATWVPVFYVSFYSGCDQTFSPAAVESGTLINIVLPLPKRRESERLAFAGWYYEDGNPFVNNEKTITEDIILVARWRNFIAGVDYQVATSNSGSSSSGGGGSSPSPSTGGPTPVNIANFNAAYDSALQNVGIVSDEARAQLAQQIDISQQDRLNAIAEEQAAQSRAETREQKVSVTKDASTTKEVSTANAAWTMDPVTGSFKLAFTDENGQLTLAQGFCNLSNPADPNAGTKSYFFNEQGELQTGWVQTADNKWYFFDTQQGDNFGAMTTGWQQVGGSWYYMNNDGSMMTGGTTPDGYTISANGTWQQ